MYQIGNADELVWFVRKVNGGENAISAILAKDIDLTDVIWTPIGNGSVAFAGSLDGANHTISNLHVDYATAPPARDCISACLVRSRARPKNMRSFRT